MTDIKTPPTKKIPSDYDKILATIAMLQSQLKAYCVPQGIKKATINADFLNDKKIELKFHSY